MVVTEPSGWRITMKPPPPMLPANGCTTASANPVATAASTALPPFFNIDTPACDARFLAETTMPFSAYSGTGRGATERAVESGRAVSERGVQATRHTTLKARRSV